MSDIKLSSDTQKLISEAKDQFGQFLETVAKLRDKEKGCPWDIKQNIKSLRPFMLEEAYEAVEAMGGNNQQDILEELGDVLLQVVLNSQVAFDEKKFNIVDVVKSVNEKMIERHPHVFSPENTLMDINSSQDVKKQWELIKSSKNSKEIDSLEYSKKMKRERHPASSHAYKIGKIAANANFDWIHFSEVFDKFKSEIKELEQELPKKNNQDNIRAEISDIYFSLAQVCRHLKIDPETVAQEGNLKFIKRFESLEKLMILENPNITEIPLDRKEELWQKIKATE